MAEVDIYAVHVSHPDDWSFVRRLVHHAPSHMLPAIFSEYCRAWKEAAEAEYQEHRKENAGRRAANTLLRLDSAALQGGCQETARKYARIANKGPAQSCHTCKYSHEGGGCTLGNADPAHLCPDWASEV